jgi:hypothetical protein
MSRTTASQPVVADPAAAGKAMAPIADVTLDIGSYHMKCTKGVWSGGPTLAGESARVAEELRVARGELQDVQHKLQAKEEENRVLAFKVQLLTEMVRASRSSYCSRGRGLLCAAAATAALSCLSHELQSHSTLSGCARSGSPQSQCVAAPVCE